MTRAVTLAEIADTNTFVVDGTAGAVRIIWGPGRSFPNTKTGDGATPAPS